MWVKPTSDPSRSMIRDPNTMALLPKEGKEVDDNDMFWLARLSQGDVELVKKQPAVADKDASK